MQHYEFLFPEEDFLQFSPTKTTPQDVRPSAKVIRRVKRYARFSCLQRLKLHGRKIKLSLN